MFLWPYHLNAIFSFIVYSLQSLPCQLLLVTWGETMGWTVEILYLLRENDLGAINNNKCLIHHLTLQTWVSQFFLFLDSNLMKRDNSALLCDVFKTLCWRWLHPRRRGCCVTSWSACSCFWTPAPRPPACPRPRPGPAGVCPLEVRLPEAGVGLPQQPQGGHHALRGPDCHTAGQEIG